MSTSQSALKPGVDDTRVAALLSHFAQMNVAMQHAEADVAKLPNGCATAHPCVLALATLMEQMSNQLMVNASRLQIAGTSEGSVH